MYDTYDTYDTYDMYDMLHACLYSMFPLSNWNCPSARRCSY